MPSQDPEATLPIQPVSEHPGPRPPIIRRLPSSSPVLPDTTSDEGDVGWGEVPEPDDDGRLLREVPPHHGS